VVNGEERLKPEFQTAASAAAEKIYATLRECELNQSINHRELD
jgi:hypothetical protein